MKRWREPARGWLKSLDKSEHPMLPICLKLLDSKTTTFEVFSDFMGQVGPPVPDGLLDSDPHPLGLTVRQNSDKPHATQANVMRVLTGDERLQGVLAFNERKGAPVYLKPPPWDSVGESGPDDTMMIIRWLDDEHGLAVSDRQVLPALKAVSRLHTFDPFSDRLNDLKWDEVERIPSFMHQYLGAADGPYEQQVALCWFNSGAQRTFEPGSPIDVVPIFEGKQGTGKSSALRILAMRPEWFADQAGSLTWDKEFGHSLLGIVIVEFSELAGMRGADVEKVKAALTRQYDHIRLPYGSKYAHFARRQIFAGTTNHSSGYLNDPTGARRFFPVETGGIDLEALKRDVEQLWAEAVHRYRNGQTSEFPKEGPAWEHVMQLREDRQDFGPWHDPIAAYIEDLEQVSVSEILEKCIDKPLGQQNQRDKNAVVRVLTRLGWERKRRRVGRRPVWVYVRPEENLAPF